MDLSNLKRDSRKVEAGQWVDQIPGMGDLRLRVRGLTSRLVVATRSRKERRVGKQEREPDLSLKPEAAMRILGETLAEVVLLDWDNLYDGDKPVPYDPDLAREFLTNPDYLPFQDAVTWAAQYVDRGMADVQEEMEKNSERPSRGSSPGASKPTA